MTEQQRKEKGGNPVTGPRAPLTQVLLQAKKGGEVDRRAKENLTMHIFVSLKA